MLLPFALAAACATGPLDDIAADPGPGHAIAAPDTLALKPATRSLVPGETQRFRVHTSSGSRVPSTRIAWAATGGTITPKDSSAVYEAGSIPGSYEVIANVGGERLAASVTIERISVEASVVAGGSGVAMSAVGTCLDQPGSLVALAGTQQKYDDRTTILPDTKVDARQASWTGTTPFPVQFGNPAATGLCWSGGTIQGEWPVGTPWGTYHSSDGIFAASPGFIVEDVTVANYGDAIRIEDHADNWTIRRMHVQDAHDDCVENDRLYSGLIDDSFFEGCYVFLSERPGGGVSIPVNGANKLVTIQNSLVWLKPMPTVYKGTAPGTGPLFKWSATASPVAITNTVFRVDKLPSHGDLNLPPSLRTCANNTIVWLGGGSYPARLPACFKVTTDRGVWDRAVADWKARHPGS